jgi:hypothetical protein
MQPGCTPSPVVTQDGDLQFDGGGKANRAAASAPPSASRIFIISAGEGSAPSWGRSLRGRRPAPSLSDRGEGRSPFVALAAAACLALTRVASEPLPAPPSATAAGRGSSADEIAGAAHGLTSNSTAFCPSLPLE